MTRNRMTAIVRQTLYIRFLGSLLALILLLALLAPTAFAKTYVIRDGDRIVTYTTFTTDPAEVLGQAGMDIQEYDVYTTEATEDGGEITIQRARRITVKYHGKTTSVTSCGETAGELLLRLKLDVTGEDVVSHGMEEECYDGMVLRIDRVVTATETYTSTIAHEVYRCNYEAIPVGTEEVLTEGTDGELLCTAEVTYVNGVETGRKVTCQTVTRNPVAEVIGVGTGSMEAAAEPYATPVIGDGIITLPTGEVLTYTDTATIRATAYTHTDKGCNTVTSTGSTVHRGTVAVDPRYIPYGTRMFIVSNDGECVYGIAEAEDCGGDIKGDRMDLYFPTHQECIQFGRRVCTLYFLG